VADNFSGSIERVTYYNPENGYSVLRVRPDQHNVPGQNREGLVTVVGNLPELAPGEYIRLRGRWETHPQHGLQFASEYCEQTLPATIEGIRRYLGSGLIRGIGPRLAEKIVAQFGVDTLDVIENRADQLSQVADIGPKRTAQIVAAWEEQKQIKEIMLFLHGHGVSTNLAVKIYKQYGQNALQIVQNDPYRLARDIYGVGFKTADRIARALGLPADHPSRIEAGVVYALNEMSGNGHVYSPRETLIQKASALLEVAGDLIPPALERLSRDDRVRLDILPDLDAAGEGNHSLREETAVYLTPFYFSETGVAERLRALAGAPSNLVNPQSNLPGTDAFSLLDPQLSAEQRAAIQIALGRPVSVLTGGPGTGKTTTIKSLIAALEMEHRRYALAAPTGRAAKRLSESTGRPARTIHRLLGFKPGEGFKYNPDNPLPLDFLVVDEVSMLDVVLANQLLKALPLGAHLLLVGDVDQLPSVGAGDVLRDVIDSEIAPVTRLSAIFRQARGSQIVNNAHRINHGEMPVFDAESTDFFLFPAATPEEASNWVQDLVCQRIPRRFGFHPRDQIQVLAPMYRGPAGVDALNLRLQAVLNPPQTGKIERNLFGQTFRVGDKLMQTENNYDKEVFNGDIGFIIDISPVDQNLAVDFDGRQVYYDWSEADQLVLAYAISVHKAQGSEFPAVVIPLVKQHYLMLQRNLLYTAITRARNLCVLVGDKRAIAIAVHNDQTLERYTALDVRLRRGTGGGGE
jgi:exodeoxyribonuclease V alpha subunit